MASQTESANQNVSQEEHNAKLVSFDFAIKYLLRDKGNYAIIEEFLSALLQAHGYPEVKILSLLDTESNKEVPTQKKSIADLIVEDKEHHQYIIEIERQQVHNYVQKALFNVSRLVSDTIASGQDYSGIKKIFHINLLYFDIGGGSVYHGKTEIYNRDTGKTLSTYKQNDKEEVLLEKSRILPEYFFISVSSFNEKFKTNLDDWLYVLKHSKVKEDSSIKCKDLIEEKLQLLRLPLDVRNEYIRYQKQLQTYVDANNVARQQGREEGEKIGLEKGREEGRLNEKIILLKI